MLFTISFSGINNAVNCFIVTRNHWLIWVKFVSSNMHQLILIFHGFQMFAYFFLLFQKLLSYYKFCDSMLNKVWKTYRRLVLPPDGKTWKLICPNLLMCFVFSMTRLGNFSQLGHSLELTLTFCIAPKMAAFWATILLKLFAFSHK
jgi:hypothetical protein